MSWFVVESLLRLACRRIASRIRAVDQARRLVFASISVALLLSWTSGVGAGTVQYAGLSFVSDAQQIEARFPHSKRALAFDDASRAQQFEAHLRDRVQQVVHPRFAIQIGALGHANEGVTRALSFAVSGESLELQRFESKTIAIYSLSAQVLFFDLSPPQRLLASYPVRVRFSDMTDSQPSEAHVAETFRRMYFDPSHPSSLTSRWLSRLAQVEFRNNQQTLQVQSVDLEDKALAALPAGLDAKQAGAEIAQFFEAAVSARVGMPMVPYTPGHVIAGKIPMSFGDGQHFELEHSQPTFALTLTVRDLRKLQVDAGVAWQVAYGSFVTLRASSVALEQELINAKFRLVESVTLPKRSGILLEDWAQHRQVLQALLDKLAEQLHNPEPVWVQSTSSTQDVIAQLNTLSQRLR